MDANELKIFVSKIFQDKVEGLKSLYSEQPELTIFVRKGKDDLKGRCLMINLQAKGQAWSSNKGLLVCLWQEDEEMQHKDLVIEKMTELAKDNHMPKVNIVESDS